MILNREERLHSGKKMGGCLGGALDEFLEK